MTFTSQLWKDIEPIYGAIIDHPYNRELAAGTLPPETFHHYLKQDALYLLDFSRALAIVSARARTAATRWRAPGRRPPLALRSGTAESGQTAR